MRNFLFVAAALWTMGMNAANTENLTVASDSSRVYDLDEVVVVSQPKESFLLRRQPVSSTLLSAQDIDLLGVRDLREISNFVPSFVMPNYGSRFTSSMYIRGIGSRVNSPAVGMYLDGMPMMNKSQYNFHLYGIDRVDVLRGPQGTLYGMNTEGGLVRLYSRNPMNYKGTDVKIGAGTKGFRLVEAAHYGQLSDKLALSVAGFYEGQDGFLKNKTTGQHADAYNEAGGKLRMVFKANERLTLDGIADYQFVKQNGFPYGQLDLKTGKSGGPAMNRQGDYRRNMLNTGLNVSYKWTGLELNSMTSYQHLHDNMLMDIDYLPQDLMHMRQKQHQNALTEELTLKGSSVDWWKWTAGVFGSYQWLRTDAPVFFDPGMNAFLSKAITDYAYNGMLNAMAQRMGMEAAAATIARAGGCNIDMVMEPIPGLFKTPQMNLGVFHQSDFSLTKQLTATLGLRYDYSKVSIDYDTRARATLSEDVMGQHVDAAVNSLLKHEEDNSFNQLLPKFGLTYKFTNTNNNIYATVTKGYRAGGYNIQMFSDILQTELQGNAKTARGEMTVEHDADAYEAIAKTIAYKPETSWNYELGSHLNLFSGQLQLDLTGYYMQVQNQQLSVMAGNYGFGRMMVNAGKSYSYGGEASLRGQAANNHLSWTLAYGYTHSVFKEYKDEVDGQTVDYKDKRVPFIPRHTMSANADYRFDIDYDLLKSITLGANATAQGDIYWDEMNTYKQKLYCVLGAHVDADFGAAVVSLWGRNLTDTNYTTFAFDSNASGQKLYFGQRGNGLQIGVDFKFHF